MFYIAFSLRTTIFPEENVVDVIIWQGVLDTTLCDKVCQRLATGRWFSSGFLHK